MNRNWIFSALIVVLMTACVPADMSTPSQAITLPLTSTADLSTVTPPPVAATATATTVPLIPDFEHIIIVVFENKEYGTVIGNPQMPYFNQLARTYTLLTQHYAVTHPSLPNYLAMIGGDTFGIDFDCTSCSVSAPSLPDLIETKGLTWKTYQEDMPAPCFPGAGVGNYAIKHNPFVYFKPIRLNPDRCARSVVPFTQLFVDLSANALPNFAFITPNLCNDAHDCDLSTADAWLKTLMDQLLPALEADGRPYLVILTWDEGQGDHSCCGLPKSAGGRVATVLVSPQVKNGFQDDSPYSHYSILKTISTAWGMTYLGHAADESTALITAPWK